MKRRSVKRVLCVVVSLIMTVTAFCFTDLGLRADAVAAPNVTFYVPETIYRDPTGSGYQYFVDSNAAGVPLAEPNKTNGLILFSSSEPFSALTIRRSDLPQTTYTAANETSFSTTFSDGNAAEGLITWTADYTVNGVPYRSVAHSYVYEPNLAQSGVLWRQEHNGSVADPEVQFFFFLTGIHSAYGGDMESNFVGRSTSDPLSAPLVKFPAGSWTSNRTPRDSSIIPSTGSNNYFTETTNGGVSRQWNNQSIHDKIWPVAGDGKTATTTPQVAVITVDISRYSDYSQIPNLCTGYAEYYHHRDGSGNRIMFIQSASRFTDSDAEDAQVSGTPNITASNVNTADNEGDYMTMRGLYALSGSLPAAGSSRTDTLYVKHKNGYSAGFVTDSLYCVVGTSLTTVCVDKSALRDLYRIASALPVKCTGDTPANPLYPAFLTALEQAGATLGDPTARQTEISMSKSTLQTAYNDLIGSSDSTATFKVTAGSAKPGTSVQVTVSTQNNPGIVATLLRLSYDPQVLTLTDVSNGEVFADAQFTPGGNLAEIPFGVTWTDAVGANHVTDGTLVTYTFSVAADAQPGETAIIVTYDADSTFDRDMNAVAFEIDNQNVEVFVRVAGDSDGDGSLDLKDVVTLVRFLAGGWDVEIVPENADVDGDGKTTLRDAVLVERYLAGGWGVVLI